MFIKTVIKQGEKITKQEKKIKQLREENAGLRCENKELCLLKNKIERIMDNADLTKENYFITFKKIKKELDAYENTLVQNT